MIDDDADSALTPPPETIGLGTLLRQLTDLLDRGSEAHYAANGITTRARYTPILRALSGAPMTVVELQAAAGVTQGAVSQTLKLMEEDGLVTRVQGSDARTRAVALTPKGSALREQLASEWAARLEAVTDMEAELGISLRGALQRAIDLLEVDPFDARIRRAHQPPAKAAPSRIKAEGSNG